MTKPLTLSNFGRLALKNTQHSPCGDVNDLQAALDQAYEGARRGVNFPIEMASRMSGPLLLKIPTNWAGRSQRILVIGQETLGWGFDSSYEASWSFGTIHSFSDFLGAANAIPAMQRGYELFEYARHQPENYRSPFWRGYRQVREVIGDAQDGLDTGVLWTNLFKTSIRPNDKEDHGSVQRFASPSERQMLVQMSGSILRRELEVLRPTGVVFCTGPIYDQLLSTCLPGVEFVEMTDKPLRALARIEHPLLPQASFRIYHPGYLNRRGLWHLFDEVLGQLRGE